MRTILEAKDIVALSAGQSQTIQAISALYSERQSAYAPPSDKKGFKKFCDLDRRVDKLVLEETLGHASALSPAPLTLRTVHHFIANLRWTGTNTDQFRTLVDHSYDVLLDHSSIRMQESEIETPVNIPTPQHAVYKHPQSGGDNICIAVVLRAGLRSAIIIGDKVQQLTGKTPNYALFRISRSHGKKEELKYFIDDTASAYRGEDIAGSSFLVPDLMLATGGSLIAIDRLLRGQGMAPKSTRVMPLFATPEGIFNLRNNTDARIEALRIDPCLNDIGYIKPGLGDAGDRLLGPDCPPEMTAMLERFNAQVGFCIRYRAQIEKIYETMGQALPEALFK